MRGDRSGKLEIYRQRPQWQHVVLALVSLGLSVGLHYLLLERLPPIPVGRTLEMPISERSNPPVQLGKVESEYQPEVIRPETYRPEDPDQTAALSDSTEKFLEALDQDLLNPVEESQIPLQGEAQALSEPTAEFSRAAFEPRQEIMQIEQALFSKEVSASPRKYVKPTPRIAEASDIVLPANSDWSEALAKAGRRVRRASEGEETAVRDFAQLLLEEPPLPLNDGESEREHTAYIEERTRSLEEKPDEVTDIQPLEQSLNLKLFTFADAADPDYTYFRLHIQRNKLAELRVLPKDVLFIQDCSESMTRSKLEECKKGLEYWLDRLGDEDRLEIMGFREEPYMCFNKWSAANPKNKAVARWFVESMRSRGKTDVYASLEKLSQIPRDANRPLIAIFITDGRPTMGVVDNSDIIEKFSEQNNGRLSVFTFGGGDRVNKFLLDLLSYKNRGDSKIVEREKDIPRALSDLGAELGRPVLTDLSYLFSGLEGTEVYPKTLTHLYLDRSCFGHLISYLRVSVTDRCNERCRYCMPEEVQEWLSKEDTMSFDEMLRVIRVGTEMGIRKVRVTGGEPLTRPGVLEFMDVLGEMRKCGPMEDLGISTNATLLPNKPRDGGGETSRRGEHYVPSATEPSATPGHRRTPGSAVFPVHFRVRRRGRRKRRPLGSPPAPLRSFPTLPRLFR